MQNNYKLIRALCDNLNRMKDFSTLYTSSNKREFLLHFNGDIYRISLLGSEGKPVSKHVSNHLSTLKKENNSTLMYHLNNHLRLFKDFNVLSLEHNRQIIWNLARKVQIHHDIDTEYSNYEQSEFLLEFQGAFYLVATKMVLEQRELTNEHIELFL